MKSILICFFLFTFQVQAQSAVQYNFKPDTGKVAFKTKGWPNLVTIKGEGKGVIGNLTLQEGKVTGELTFDLTTLKTGIELRDDHMKDTYLEVKKFPKAKLKLTSVEVPKDMDGDMKFKGLMTLHGVEKEVSGKAELDKDDKKIKMSAEVPIKLSDFKIAIPSYKGITVAEKVKVSFESEVVTQ